MEKAQLLRPLILILWLISAGFVQAEDAVIPNFAPGATGNLGVDVTGLLDRARRDAETLGQDLTTAAPMATEGMEDGIKAIERRAMNDPRLRDLLGLSSEGTMQGDDKPGYGEARVLIFASFAMPGPSLAKVLRDARKFHAVVVFRGFLKNSVVKTGTALRAALGEEDDPEREEEGFAIDPTLFTRFDVKAVPVYVVLNAPLNPCEAPHCEGDVLPEHDRLSGNIPLETALSLVAAGQGDAAATAARILGQAGTGKDFDRASIAGVGQ